MTTKELFTAIKSIDSPIYVKIEDGLYYPITEIRQENNAIILFCPNINKEAKMTISEKI